MSDDGKPRIRVRRPEVTTEFLTRLARVFDESHLTLEELSVALGGYAKNTIWRVKAGKSSQMAIDLFLAIAQWAMARNYSLEWLFAGTGEPAAPKTGAVEELRDAARMGNHVAIIVAFGLMAKYVGMEIGEMSKEWGEQIGQGRLPELDGGKLVLRVNKFIKEH